MPPKEPRSFWTISRSSRQQTLSWPLDHSVGKLCGFMQLRGIFSGTCLQNPVRYGMINTVILDMPLSPWNAFRRNQKNMNPIEIILGIVLLLFAIAIILFLFFN